MFSREEIVRIAKYAYRDPSWFGDYSCEQIETILKVAKEVLEKEKSPKVRKLLKKLIKDCKDLLNNECKLDMKCSEGDIEACRQLYDLISDF